MISSVKNTVLCNFRLLCTTTVAFAAAAITLYATEVKATKLSSCQPPIKQLEKFSVSYVFDGDTVELTDKRRIRLVGFNTPETARKQRPAEPLAVVARTELISLLKKYNNKILLQVGKDNKDRYGRTLAHAWLPSAPKPQSIAHALLAKGLASVIAIPPNLSYSECYQQAEKKAQEQNLGIWQHTYFAEQETTKLDKQSKGFKFIRGKVTQIGKSKKSIWITLEGGVVVKLDKRDLDNFTGLLNEQSINKLLDKTISLRGWVYPRQRELQIRLRHPAGFKIH